MHFCVLINVVLALSIPAAASAPDSFGEGLPHIGWQEAAEHYGERCVVYGTVVAAKDIHSRCFLNFDPDFRTSITVVVNRENYGKFPDRPDRIYRDKHVRVIGTIVEFQNKPEIILESPEAIEIIDDPSPPATVRPPAVAADKAAPQMVTTTAPVGSAARWMPPPDGVITIATFNVLNLFDDFDDPYVANEYLPGKPDNERKLLARTIHQLDADVLALQEVENRPCLEHFVASHLADMSYREVVFFEGNSSRGIDVALLSRFAVGPVTSYRHMDFVDGAGAPMRFNRDLLQVRIQPEGLAAFDVFVVHLKSKLGGEEQTLPARMGEATAMRMIFDDILRRDPGAAFVVCGDFNDTIESEPLKRILGTGPSALAAFVEDLSSDKPATLKKWDSMIDFILASPSMLAMYRPGSYRIVADLTDSNGSDHNPVTARFGLARTAGPN